MRVDRHSGHSASIVALEVERRTREEPQSEQFKLDGSGALRPAGPLSGRPVGDTTPDASDPEDASWTIVNAPLQSVHVPVRIRASRPTNSTAAPQWGQELDISCLGSALPTVITSGGGQ